MEGDLWSGLRRCLRIGVARLFCVMDSGERCNKKERRIEETKIVKRMVKIVKRGGEIVRMSVPEIESEYILWTSERAKDRSNSELPTKGSKKQEGRFLLPIWGNVLPRRTDGDRGDRAS